MVALLTLAQSQSNVTPYGGVLLSPIKSRRPSMFRKIRPKHCKGQFDLSDVSFAYPSRPTMPVLQDVSIFLPSQETSFIVGGSGSGKSTLAQLLLRMYNPTTGSIFLDDQELSFLDEDFTREHIAAVSQNCILFDMSVHDNVAMGLAGPGSSRKPQDVTREEVIRVCRAALMHEFVRDLPDGYDTQLGTNGANLSGGQKQRLAIARALLRNPTVLILGELTRIARFSHARMTDNCFLCRRGDVRAGRDLSHSRVRGDQALAPKHDYYCYHTRPFPDWLRGLCVRAQGRPPGRAGLPARTRVVRERVQPDGAHPGRGGRLQGEGRRVRRRGAPHRGHSRQAGRGEAGGARDCEDDYARLPPSQHRPLYLPSSHSRELDVRRHCRADKQRAPSSDQS